MPVSFIFAYACPVTQRYRQRRAWKVLLFSMEIQKIQLMIAHTPTINDSRNWLLCFGNIEQKGWREKHFCNQCSYQVLHEAMMWRFCNRPHLWRKKEGEKRYKKDKGVHDACIAAALVGEKAHLGTKWRGPMKKSYLLPYVAVLIYACLKAAVR